jgi:hypothetical protein
VADGALEFVERVIVLITYGVKSGVAPHAGVPLAVVALGAMQEGVFCGDANPAVVARYGVLGCACVAASYQSRSRCVDGGIIANLLGKVFHLRDEC